MNDKGINWWDADAVAWSTIEVTITQNYSVNVTSIVDDSLNDAYTTNVTQSGNKTKTYTFSRETMNPRYGIGDGDVGYVGPAADKFWVVRGLDAVGAGATPPFFRGLLSGTLYNSFFDDAETWDITYAVSYTLVGPPTDPMDPDLFVPDEIYINGGYTTTLSGTANSVLTVDLSLSGGANGTYQFSGGVPSWGVIAYGGFVGKLPTAFVFGGGTMGYGAPSITVADDGPEVRIWDYKTVAGELIDFGVSFNIDATTAPDNDFWLVSSWDDSATVEIVCS